ncbi:hypothetical protein CEXT_787361 [Caerostris extrusa]|uniref:Ycf15 n=1 Tax=Caerostris extrusa TaxID=172846 RepID=A0AAV4VNX1_CAEEX|nr:hypothetical protein CEXT_787361 [Caerostris extrusa]
MKKCSNRFITASVKCNRSSHPKVISDCLTYSSRDPQTEQKNFPNGITEGAQCNIWEVPTLFILHLQVQQEGHHPNGISDSLNIHSRAKTL